MSECASERARVMFSVSEVVDSIVMSAGATSAKGSTLAGVSQHRSSRSC